MEFDRDVLFSDDPKDESVSLKEVIENYLIYWKWFVFSIIICLSFIFVKLRYEIPKYNITAKILIKDQEKGSSFTDLTEFENLGLFSSSSSSLENEIQILKSREILSKVVEELKLNISYFLEKSPYNKEAYPNSPIVLNLVSDSIGLENVYYEFSILIKSDNDFELFDNQEISRGVVRFNKLFKFNFGDENGSDVRNLIIEKNVDYGQNLIGEKIHVSINPINSVVNEYLDLLTIEPINEKLSDVLSISIKETNVAKGIAIINNLIEQYNADGINDNNEITQYTTDFLDLRIGLISTEIGAIETMAEQFQTKNRMMDSGSNSDIFLQSSSATESELVAANTQLQLTNYMLAELSKSSLGELLPGNIGLSDNSIVSMISDYNNLALQRKRILKSSSEINPIILNIDSQLQVLKSNLSSSLTNLVSSLGIRINALNKQSGKINSRIASVPKNEKELKDIVRQQETKNALYLFLLQKREESILSSAVKIEKAKVVDRAYSNGRKISPKKMISYIGALIAGIFIPFIILYIMNLLDTKVHDERDVTKYGIPYLGDIPWSQSFKDKFITEGDDSNIAEAFRYIRTNINFMLDRNENGKVVFVTSTQSSEGKSFAAINLASSLAISEKKTLLIGMDLRAPKVAKYFDLNNKYGITNYIKSNDLNIKDLIEYKSEYLSVMHSGDIPPNPGELLMSKGIESIFDYVKKEYDYIIVDTAPVGMVTDTIQIGNYADLTIYMVKANYLDKRKLRIPEKLNKEKKLINMAFVINATNSNKGAYGYGYGYGNKKKDTWLGNFFKKNNS